MPADALVRLETSLVALHAKLDGLILAQGRIDARLDEHDREIGQLRAADVAQDEQIVGLREARASAQGGLAASGAVLAGTATLAALLGGALAWLLGRIG